MPRIAPIPAAEATEKVAQLFERVREMFGGALPAPFLIYARVPAFLQDFCLNFRKFVWAEGQLDPPTKATLALATSAALRCGPWIDVLAGRIEQLSLPAQHIADTLAVAATCQMYNVAYKFRDQSGSAVFEKMGVGLRAHTFGNTSLDAKTVELINVVISNLGGCKPCTAGHVEKALQLGFSHDAILEAVQCAATMAAGCGFLSAAGE
jgi:alkyl hydroperoxide reductase subunit D